MKTLQQLGTDLGALLEEKNAAYGSSFSKSGRFLALLWPDGIPAARYDDALLLVRIFDKQMRIATDNDSFGESPYQDIAGYGLLGTQLHQRKDSATCPGSASDPNASSSSKAQHASAPQLTNARTITSASATTASEPSPQPASSSSLSATAPAPTAMENANVDGVDRVKEARRNNLAHTYEHWLYRSNTLRCVGCEVELANRYKRTVPVRIRKSLNVINFHACLDCHEVCLELLRDGHVTGAMLP